MEHVIILMSTFNGEKYIAEQIESILHQNDVYTKLLVRDDGSNDATFHILETYQQKYKNSIEIISGKNIGWKKSFFELLDHAAKHYSKYQYFAFADQDDIWLPQKTKTGIEKIKGNHSIASLYCANQYYYKDGKNHGLIRQEIPKITYKKCLTQNIATGCTMIFNQALLKLATLEYPAISTAHDFWLYQIACLCGKVFYDPSSYILYRQHDNNQIGHKANWLDVWKRRLQSLVTKDTLGERERRARELYRIYGVGMYPEAQSSTKKLIDYKKNVKNRINLLMDNDYNLSKKSNTFWFKVRIVLGIV